MTKKPLMLKDYLELDWNTEPTAAGFHSAPRRADGRATTVRFLLEAELRCCGRRKQHPPQTRSLRAMQKISALFNAVGLLPFAGSEGVSSRSFWRKRGKVEKRLKAKDTVHSRSREEVMDVEERVSFDLPSPVVSSCSGCSEFDSLASDFLQSSVASSDPSDDVTAGEENKDSPRCSPIRGPDERIGARKEAGVSAAVHCREVRPLSLSQLPNEIWTAEIVSWLRAHILPSVLAVSTVDPEASRLSPFLLPFLNLTHGKGQVLSMPRKTL